MAARRWASPALVALVGVALAAGAGAALLAGATPVAQPTSGPGLQIELPYFVWGILFVLPLALGLGAVIVRRLQEHTAPLAGKMLVYAAVILMLGLAFLPIAHFAGSGGCLCTPLSQYQPPPANNSSNPGNNSSSHGGDGNGSLTGVGPPLSVATALPYVVVAAVGIGLAAVVIPLLLVRAERRRGGVTGDVRPSDDGLETLKAFSAAATELDQGRDPRAVIVRLYDRLLVRVTPLVGDVSFSTAEEIRASHLVPLGVRPSAAEALTRLFEEARYSSHPLSPDAVVRARDAIGAAEADLTRVGAAL